MGPEARTGRYCASTSVKLPVKSARARRRQNDSEREGMIPVFSIVYPLGIFIIRDLVQKTSLPRIKLVRTNYTYY